jgi:Uma2 family endonuclease
VTLLPHGRPLTRADLDRMPDDGHRYELVDGVLVVSPSPKRLHQRAVYRLWQLLNHACTPEFEVVGAPFDVVLAEDTVLIPDVLVARRTDLTDKDLPAAPALVVEVLSPSTPEVRPDAQAVPVRGGRRAGVLGGRSGRAVPGRLGVAGPVVRRGRTCDG